MLAVGDETHDLSRDEAVQLRDALADALTRTREFVRTTGTHREDGSYVVERRNADSTGHRKVFASFENCARLFERLPRSFTADDVGHTGLTGGRRHMLLWHFAEHPAFDCELASRQPLTVEKTGVDDAPGDGAPGGDVALSGDATAESAGGEAADDGDHLGVLPADD